MKAKLKARKFVLLGVTFLVTVFGIIASMTVWSQDDKPSSKQPAGTSPSRIIASKNRQIPTLNATAANAQTVVSDFIKFAGESGGDQHEAIRKNLQAAGGNRAVVDAFCNEAFRAQKEDHSQTLFVLSLLGEIKSSFGLDCLSRFMKIPFPQTGTVVDGEIVEQSALATLQAKTIDGLAYLNTAESNRLVLDAVKNHPSIIVRAEAIEAYLWNQRDKAAARKELLQVVRKGEEIYLDRVRRETNEDAATFNRKVAAFLKKHPEVRPPKPEPDKVPQKPKDEKPVRIPVPPKF